MHEPKPARVELLGLTSVRGWLALWVVTFHLAPLTAVLFPELRFASNVWLAGDVAVDIFFMLSGFVIALSYADRLSPFRLRAYTEFLWARLARLYPAHAVQQVCWALLLAAAAYLGKVGMDRDSIVPLDFVRNLTLTQSWEAPMKTYWNYPAWSISLEWAAYLVAPVLLALASTFGKSPARRVLATGGLWVLLLATREYPAQHFVRCFSEFLVGALLAGCFLEGAATPRLRHFSPLLGALCVIVMVTLRTYGLLYYWAMPVAALFLLSLASAPAAPRFLGGHVGVYLGRISYSMYMAHALVITVMHHVVPPEHLVTKTFAVRCAAYAAYIACILLAGVMSYHIVEEPSRKRMQRFVRTHRSGTNVPSLPAVEGT